MYTFKSGKTKILHLSFVPDNWEIWKLKFLVNQKLKYGANEVAEFDDVNYPRYIRITDFDGNGRLRSDTFKSLPPEKAEEYLLEDGDILFARSGATVGKTFQFKNYNGAACFAGYLVMARPDTTKILSDFLYYFTKSDSYLNWINSVFIQSTIQNVGADKYSIIELPKPSIFEQQKIAAFLDYKTALIDKFIANRKRQIELLEEKKAAIINKAVTKGINPGVKLKPSGVEWIGDIPEHWEVFNLKYLLIEGSEGLQIGPFGSMIKSDILVPNGFKIYGQENVIYDDFTIGEKYIDKYDFQRLSKYTISPNDIVITMMGTAGRSKVVPSSIEKGIMDSHLTRIRIKPSLVSNTFISLLINDSDYIKNNIAYESRGSIMDGLNSTIIKTLKIALPPKNEIDKIENYLKLEVKKIKSLSEKYKKQIELIEEYKTSLISKAVTGKIDVRDWQPPKKENV